MCVIINSYHGMQTKMRIH